MNDRDRDELYRPIGERFLRSPELPQMLETPFVGVAEAVAAWVEQMDRQALDVGTGFDAQLAEISRGIASALDTYISSIDVPRVEIFSETLDQVRTDIEMVPYHLPSTPAPVGGISAPGPQPSVPDRAQRNVDAFIVNVTAGLVVFIIGNVLWFGIVWYAQTGRWEFEELLAYLVRVVI